MFFVTRCLAPCRRFLHAGLLGLVSTLTAACQDEHAAQEWVPGGPEPTPTVHDGHVDNAPAKKVALDDASQQALGTASVWTTSSSREAKTFEAQREGLPPPMDESYLGEWAAMGKYRRHVTQGPRDICIVTHHTPACETFALLSARSHDDYAATHGYPIIVARGLAPNSPFFNPDSDNKTTRFGLSWQKLSTVADALNERLPGRDQLMCQWVMWVDADTLFTHFETTLESILQPYADKDVVLAREEIGYLDAPINAGVFFVKNSPGGRGFVDDIVALYPTYRDRRFWEQDAVRDWALGEGADSGLGTARQNVGLAPQRLFNAFYGGHAPPGSPAEWQPGDFLAHLPNTQGPRRHALMSELLVRLARKKP